MMRHKPLAAIAMTLTAGGCPQTVEAAVASLRSGFYEGFVLAVSPAGRVVGHFAMAQGEGVVKRCGFDFAGRANGNHATIRTLGSPALAGRIRASAIDEVVFAMAGVRSLPDCGLIVPPEAEDGGIELDRIRPVTWTDLARIRSARATFSTAPGGPAGRAYVVKGDVVGILARRGDRVQVVYPSERDTWSRGWVVAADLAPLAP